MRKRTHHRRQAPAKPSLDTTPFQVEIQRLSHEGRGVARRDGKTLFISGALPGETVTAQLTARHSRYDEATCTEIVSPSPDRVTPVCKHYGQCGGCDLQHLHQDRQVDAKMNAVLEQLERLGNVVPEQVEPPLRSDATGYRRSARIGINQRQRDGGLIIGFRRKGSSKLTPIDHCPVLAPVLNDALALLTAELDGQDNVRDITHAEVTLGDDGGALTLRIKKRPAAELLSRIQAAAAKLNLTLYLDDGDRITPVGEDRALFYRLPEQAVELYFRPGDFLQVNAALNQQMVSRALEWLAPTADDRVLDLFSGIGNFTLPLARRAGSVVGVEGSEAMVERARDNARHNELDNCEFYRANLSGDLRHHPWFRQGFSKIVLDPPRAGAADAIAQLGHYNASQILYVSCNPAALARDAAALVEQGYHFRRFCVMDMFPHTAHVESMALFEKSAR